MSLLWLALTGWKSLRTALKNSHFYLITSCYKQGNSMATSVINLLKQGVLVLPKFPMAQKEVQLIQRVLKNSQLLSPFNQAAQSAGQKPFCATLELQLSEELADTIREICAEHLQERGFGKEYELTEVGKDLESIIDKLET